MLLLVVYLLIPTSNHNYGIVDSKRTRLYIFWFLHQTTTIDYLVPSRIGCISFDSYIKPQPSVQILVSGDSCISFDSYIKPQRNSHSVVLSQVVYLLIPTSNHNYASWFKISLRVVYLLIPTSNHNLFFAVLIITPLYIFWFLHQTTTWLMPKVLTFQLYIFWFLHQTTTETKK